MNISLKDLVCPYCGKQLKKTKLKCEYLRIDNLTGEWFKEVCYSGDMYTCDCLNDRDIVGWTVKGVQIQKGESIKK
jgi:hypothetical protein